MKISAKKDVAVVLPIHGSSSSTSTSTSSAVPTASSAADSVTASAVSADVVVKKGRGRPKASTVVADAKASAQASSVATSSIGSTATPMPAPVTAVVSPAVDGSPRSTRGIKLDFRALLGASSSPSATSSAAVPAVAAVEAVDPAVAGAAAQQARQEAEAAAQQARQEAEYRELEHTTGHLCYEIKRVSVLNCLTFKCPQHYCNNCYDFYGAKDGCDINKCLACARAFHVNCIPPGSRFNSVCLLCPRHPDDPLPSHEMRLDPRTKRPKSTSNMFTQFWEQLAIPDVLPNANDPYDNHFKLQQHIRDDVAGAAAPFTVISRNDYSFMAGKNTAPKFIPEVRCECKIDCDENCLNRILRIECCDTKIKTAGESGDMVSTRVCLFLSLFFIISILVVIIL